jgi:hypothetical protein
MMEELVNNQTRFQGAYSVNEWRALDHPLEERGLYARPDIGASLIVTLLLSLGLWAGIWGTIISLFSAAF